MTNGRFALGEISRRIIKHIDKLRLRPQHQSVARVLGAGRSGAVSHVSLHMCRSTSREGGLVEVVEEWVLEGTLGRQPRLRVVRQQLLSFGGDIDKAGGQTSKGG